MSTNLQELVPGETCFNLNFSNPGGSQLSTGRDSSGPTAVVVTNTPSTPTSLLNGNGMSPGLHGSNGKPEESGRNGNGPGRGSLNLPNGKKTKGRVKIKMEFIDNKLRRYTTFSKRKTGIMKKAYELSTLTGTQVMLLVASETGHVYTFATKKLQPMITSEAGKALIQTCLNSPDFSADGNGANGADGATTSTLSTNFHTTDMSTPGRKRAKLESNFSLNDEESAKSSPKSYYQFSAASPSGLPTMVPPSWGSAAIFRSGSDDDDNDDDDDDDDEIDSDISGRTSPSSQNLGSSESTSVKAEPISSQPAVGQSQSATANGSQPMFKMPNGQFLFPGFIPTSSAAGLTSAQAAAAASYANLGFVPSITPNGAVMYQMPQGLVYAPNPAMLNEGSGQNFLFAGFPQSSDQNGQPQQQFITIPVPFPMGNPTVIPSANGSTNQNSAVKEEPADKPIKRE